MSAVLSWPHPPPSDHKVQGLQITDGLVTSAYAASWSLVLICNDVLIGQLYCSAKNAP